MQDVFGFLDDLLEGINFNDEENAGEVLYGAYTEGAVRLGSLHTGDEFEISEMVFIVLGVAQNGGIQVIQKDFLEDRMQFGPDANWKNSPIREYLNSTYYNFIANAVGEENIICITRDLTSRDGLDDYGVCEDNISILSEREYAEFHRILGVNSNYDKWWWTLTPFSAPSNGYSRYVCCVDSDGALSWDFCDGSNGVRPLFTLESSILVSKHNVE